MHDLKVEPPKLTKLTISMNGTMGLGKGKVDFKNLKIKYWLVFCFWEV